MEFCRFLFVLVLSYLVKCESDEYDDENASDDKNNISDIDSSSLEVYNISSNDRPARLNVRGTANESESNGVTNKFKISSKEDQNSCKHSATKYPYSASIQRKGSHYASGALIDKRWVVSVASDFYNVRESIRLFKTRLGSVNNKKEGVLVRITRLEIHPSFIPKKPSYDISLLRLATPVTFSEFVKPIAISGLDSNILDANFLTTYWPRLVVHGMVLPNIAKERIKPTSMRISTQKLIPWKECSLTMQHLGEVLDKNSLCMRPLMSHHSMCMPDLGAPVVADDLLWGITSGWISEDCRQTPSPTIFTRVSSPSMRSWLAEYRAIS